MYEDDYYSFHPPMMPKKDIVVTSFVSTFSAHVGGALALMCGLSLKEVPRWVEGEARMSVAEVVFRQGMLSLRTKERGQLATALSQAPKGIVTVTDGALIDSDARALVRKHATLVYLRADLDELFEKTLWELEHSRHAASTFALHAPASIDDLKDAMEERVAGFHSADVIIDVQRRPPHAVAQEIRNAVGLARSIA